VFNHIAISPFLGGSPLPFVAAAARRGKTKNCTKNRERRISGSKKDISFANFNFAAAAASRKSSQNTRKPPTQEITNSWKMVLQFRLAATGRKIEKN